MYDAKYHAAWKKRNPDKVKANAKRYAVKNAAKLKKYRELNKHVHRTYLKLWARRFRAKPGNRENIRHRQIIRRYGLTQEQFAVMLKKQGSRCGVCRKSIKPAHRGKDAACIDHCHKSGKVRGLLCFNCNCGIGQFKDKPALLRKAIKWIA